MARIGVISDTHGLLRTEALAALEGSHRIIHGGDVGTARVLDELSRIAPSVSCVAITTRANGQSSFPTR
jgi:predicted phosphodiesterase